MPTHQKVATVLACECNRCGAKWTARKAKKPYCCARCRTRLWDTPRERKIYAPRKTERGAK